MKRRLLAASLALALFAVGATPALAHEVFIQDPENRPEGAGPPVRRVIVGNPALIGNPDERPAHVITDGEGFRIEIYAAALGGPDT